MTLDRRRRRNADIFDTGFGGSHSDAALMQAAIDYAAANPTINPTDSPELYQVPTAAEITQNILDNKIAEFNGNMDAPTTEEYEGYTIKRYGGGKWPSKKYMFVIYDPSGTMVEVLLGSNWVAISAEKKKFIDDRAGTAFVPNQESVDAGLVADLTSVQGVAWSYNKGLIEYATAYNTLMNTFSMSDNDISDLLGSELEELLERYESDRGDELSANYNPSKPLADYEAGTYLLPNVGNATAANTKIPGSSYHYWNGDLLGHTWSYHGISTKIATGADGSYPKPIVDSFGGYALSISHYIADYNNQTGEFLGFRPLTTSQLDGGVPAGIPIASVMQFFTKPAKTRSGKDFDNFTWTGRNFFFDTEKTPIWRKAISMPMKPKNFFLLETELAVEDKIDVHSGGPLIQNTQFFSVADVKSTSATHSNGTKSLFGNLGSKKTLDRQFHQGKWGGFRTVSKSKVRFGAKVEWLGDDGQFGSYSTHPPSIPDCNEEGKTMVVYRFPRQLDPVVDKRVLDFHAANGVDYSISATKECYPFPGADADKDKYALIGRMMPTSKQVANAGDDIGAEKFEAEIDGMTLAGRRSINFVPMVSAGFPTTDYHRPYVINQSESGVSAEKIFDKTDWFCFDTSDVDGARISVTDPYKKAFFDSGRINNAYFAQGDLKVGSTAFAVGQCMLTYEMSNPSVDAKLSLVNLPHASERIIITTETQNMDSSKMPFRSDELQPREPRDGSLAGSNKSDYLPPLNTITTDDLVSGNNPVGMLAIKETYKELFGHELTAESFGNLVVGSKDKFGSTDPNNPLRYIVSTTYGTFSFPYTIAGFSIPGHYKGPVLEYSEEVDANNNFRPLEATPERPGLIGSRNVFFAYQSPFGVVTDSTVSLDKQIQRQLDIIEEGGTVADVFQEQTEEGGIDEGRIEDTSQALQEEKQFEAWLADRLREDYGNVRFTDTAFKAYFKWWNKDYVTGGMFLDAGYPIPGVDLAPYYAEARRLGIPIEEEQTEQEEQEQQSVALAGLGAFTDSSGFTVTDVTAKWGTLGAAKARYTGDIGMSMVPYKANVTNEQLGYLAMSNLDGIENPTNIGNITDDVGTAIKYAGGGAGAGFAIAGIGIAGSAILVGTVAAVNMIAARKSAEKLAERL